MPRIDPLALLNCLSVLLGPNGGIKGTKEVDRLATLMTKFSKKLVSKCIYIQILKTTNTELLNQFMSTGGWDLIHIWLTDAIVAKNTALIQELLELLLLCPVDIARLKSNNNPKLIKGLSKEGSLQSVRTLACRLVDQWLKIVKDSVPSEPQQPITMAPNNLAVDVKVEPENPIKIEENLPPTTTPPSTVSVQDLVPTISPLELPSHQQFHDKIHLQPVQLQIVNKTLPGQSQPTQIKKQSFVVVSSTTTPPSVPVYKITIRDGKQVLTKVETDAANITKNLFNDDKDQIKLKEEIKNEVDDDVDSRPESGDNDQITPANEHSAVDAKEAGKNGTEVKSSDKENRDSPKKEDKTKDDKKSHHKSSSKSSSSSRHSSSKSSSSSSRSSSHKSSSSSRSGSSSSKSSSRDKDRHHSSSRHSSSSKSRSEREKEKEKERLKKDQAEKDKATLEKVQGQAINAKIGKIPKKKPDDEKSGDTSSIRKSSTDSRDSSKENKTDAKKTTATGGVVPAPVIIEKKNISISIENRKNSQESSRPKTVKTFNSKFRSTGLEEEVKPPPSRAASKKQTTQLTPGSEAKKIIVPPPKISLKRASPLRETGSIADKRAKLSLDPPVINAGDDKKGAIKLIAPKPKPMVLQESDMFMDALTASTKNEKPRKRKRRNSLSKDGTESKRMDTSVDSSKESSPTPQSPPGPDERSPISFKPEFKFYQDTLEINEDKEQSTNDKSPEIESPEPKDRTENAEDDEGSRTPTGEEEIDELKPPASPDNDDDAGKTPASPNSEIRYVDGLRSVLLMQKRKGPKKSLKWKEDLESIRYFELDETERVNVTKTFTDMKQMEKQGEREAFQMARKLSTEDLMEERTRWRALIPIDMPPPLVEPGKDSKEREIQYAREKGILQALYFNRSMIPDSPSEPDEERHHAMTDPKIIPLDDLTGNRESEKDFTSVPWPEPKPQLTPTPPVASVYTAAFAHNPVVGIAPAPQMVMNPPMTPMIPVNHVEVTGGGGWRTGDGKVVVPDVNMASINNLGFPPPNMMPPPGMFNHAQPPDAGFPGMPPGMDDGNFPMPNNFQGPNMFGPGPNFQGPPPPRGGGGGGGGGGGMHGNRGRGGPGWFRGGPGPIRGAGWANRGAWRGGKQPPVCRQFTKNGFCRVGDKCQYLHPGVNCPPF